MYLTLSPPLMITAQDAPQRVPLRVEEAFRRAHHFVSTYSPYVCFRMKGERVLAGMCLFVSHVQ